jgi:hypothetical protein
MKRVLIFAFFLLSFNYSASGQDPLDLLEEKRDRLIGGVSTVRTETVRFSFDSGMWTKNPRTLNSIDAYDRIGNLTNSTHYRVDGSIGYEWIPPADPNEGKGGIGGSGGLVVEFDIKPEYDDKARVIKESDITTEGERVGWREFKYDAVGNRIEEKEYRDDSFDSKLVHTYDRNGNRILTIRYVEDGQPEGKWAYRYNERGDLIEYISYHPDDRVSGTTRYTYDSKGNIIEEASYDSDGSLSNKETYTYKNDSKGNWVERTNFFLVMIGPNKSPHEERERIREITYRTITYY